MSIARKNLRFECTRCGDCCEKPGWVHFTRTERTRAARLLEISPADFRERYGGDDYETWIRVTRRQSCPFFVDRSCSIYSARPEQCRSFPFWIENMRSWKDWNRLCRSCPGAGRNGNGSSARKT